MTQANSLARRATPADWIEGARLRTLPLSVAPVVLGTGLAAAGGEVAWGRALLCLWVSLWLQIGVNYANDYSDGIRGTDGEDRVGPARLTGGGLARPSTVRTVAFGCFGLAALGGLLLVALCGQWWLLLIGCVAVAAAWFYTGGRHPYGYAGLGELFVFVFFGLVATVGTVFVQTLRVQVLDWIAAVAMGLFACAVLMVNNLRDIETDPRQGKHTLAVRLGAVWAERAFAGLVLVPVLLLIPMSLLHPGAVLGLLCLPLAELALRDGLFPRTARDRIAALRWTSLSALLFALAAAVGLWI